MECRALRAATTVEADTIEDIGARTVELIGELIDRNGLALDQLVSIVFSVTSDLRSVAPAAAVRQMGIIDVPLLCLQEMDVDGALERCIRVLAHVNTTMSRGELRHVYLHGAAGLRPDLAGEDRSTGPGGGR